MKRGAMSCSKPVQYILLSAVCISFCFAVHKAFGEDILQHPANVPKISTAQAIMNDVVINLLKKDIASLKKLKSYHCTFIKQEMFDNKLNHEETIDYYYKAPCMIYMKWTNKQEKGLTAVYDCKKDKGHFFAKDSGLAGSLGFMKFRLNSTFVKVFHPNHWQINQSDIIFISEMILDQMEDSIETGQFLLSSIKVTHDSDAGADTLRFDAFLSDKPVNGILYKKASLWVDSNTLIPVKFMLYNFKDELYERYVLKNIELNVDIPQSLFAAVK
ncbi:MAG: DUF1571 domain-containing protein [Deltaproteobacteria bacterium]|nr:DUF1571 domain-containing protein [Deltaproteobacteria bacterium]